MSRLTKNINLKFKGTPLLSVVKFPSFQFSYISHPSDASIYSRQGGGLARDLFACP